LFQKTKGITYGYLFLTEREFSDVLENRGIKSACTPKYIYTKFSNIKFTLLDVHFQDYMEATEANKKNHPWKSVYNKYYHDALRNIMPDNGLSSLLSDADVFSYLCWRHVRSFGKLDTTASARAIYFHLEKPVDDKEDKLSPNIVPINLTNLCKNGGEIFKPAGDNVWKKVTLREYEENLASIEGSRLGCIVLPSGEISPEDIILDKLNNSGSNSNLMNALQKFRNIVFNK